MRNDKGNNIIAIRHSLQMDFYSNGFVIVIVHSRILTSTLDIIQAVTAQSK